MKRIFFLSLSLSLLMLVALGGAKVRAQGAAQAQPQPAQQAQNQAAMIVLIFDTHCKTACELVRPIMHELKSENKDCFTFVELDSSQEKLAESQAKAKEIGVHPFLASYAQFVPVVGVFNAKKKCIRVIDGAKSKDVYAAALQKALQCK